MSGPKRNPDKLNTIGVVVVGICGAVLVYVSITALQAFYMNDTSPIQDRADYGDQDLTAKGKRADELRNITEPASNAGGSTYRIRIEDAMKGVIADAKTDPSHLTGKAMPPSVTPTIPPAFGRPKLGGDNAAPPAGGAGSGSAAGAGSAAPAGAGSAAPAGAGSAAPAGAGSAAPAGAGSAAGTGSAAAQTPTGAGGGGAAGASPGANAAQPSGSGATARPNR